MHSLLLLVVGAYGDSWTGQECAERYGNNPVLNPTLTVEEGVAIFAACGLLVLPANDTHHEAVSTARTMVADRLEPFLVRRARLRKELRSAMYQGKSLRSLGQDTVTDESSILTKGNVFRERNDCRIDLTLDSEFDSVLAAFFYEAPRLIRSILGGTEEARLHSRHAVVALAGCALDQHWHRDTPPLFTSGGPTPAYAINAFVYLDDMRSRDGATQFVLGSHLWPALHWNEHPDLDIELSFSLPSGSIILADYRTVHRGPFSTQDRYMLMWVYGRKWWHDSTNYHGEDYGGFKLAPQVPDDTQPSLFTEAPNQNSQDGLDRSRQQRWGMYWGLVNQWEEGLKRELNTLAAFLSSSSLRSPTRVDRHEDHTPAVADAYSSTAV